MVTSSIPLVVVCVNTTSIGVRVKGNGKGEIVSRQFPLNFKGDVFMLNICTVRTYPLGYIVLPNSDTSTMTVDSHTPIAFASAM